MTKEEWKKVEENLQIISSIVKLDCDGYEVTLSLQQISQFKNGIVVYVNGVFKGKWLIDDCEERKRFLPCKTKTLVKEKDIKAMGSSDFRMTKKRVKEFKDKYSYYVYSNTWTSFREMKKHFEQNNQSIKIIDIMP